jgi:hypothetical protein
MAVAEKVVANAVDDSHETVVKVEVHVISNYEVYQ